MCVAIVSTRGVYKQISELYPEKMSQQLQEKNREKQDRPMQMPGSALAS